MKITDKDVTYIAILAKLELSESERQKMISELNSILGYIDLLDEVDTANVPPMSQIRLAGRTGDALREDELLPCLPRDIALGNAPDADENFFKVPKVIEKE